MRGRIRIAIECTGLLLVSARVAHAQSTYRETGSVTVGGYLLWVRGTNERVVELYIGRGFRDAFAKAHDMDAARVQQWIDSVRAVDPVPSEDSGSTDAQLRGASLGPDVTMLRRVGGTFSGLRLLVAGEDPIRMAEPTARDFIAILDSAARVTRELSAPPPSIMASMPMQTNPQAASAAAVAPVAVHSSVDTLAAAQVHTSVAAPALSPVSQPATPPTAGSMGPSTAEAAPDLVLPAPSQPMTLLGTRNEAAPLPSPVVAPSAVVPVASEPMPPAAAAVRDTSIPAHVDVPSDKLIRTPLGPFTIPGALLSDRDKEAQYCYTQLGLKYNPDLKGEITVTLSLRTDGAVQDAVVTKRTWQGISAGEVESCVRALAHDWTFASSDPSIADGSKVVKFSFAP